MTKPHNAEPIHIFVGSTGGVGALAQACIEKFKSTGQPAQIHIVSPVAAHLGAFAGGTVCIHVPYTKFDFIFSKSKALGLILTTLYSVLTTRPAYVFCWGREIATMTWFFQAAACIRPCVSMFSSSHTSEHLKTKPPLTRLFLTLLYRLMLPRMLKIGAQTHDMADDLNRNFGVAANNIVQTPPIISEVFFTSGADMHAQRPRCFVFAGRLAPEKNIPFILRAFSIALNDAPDLKLVIMGDGPLAHELKTLAARLLPEKNYVFTGPSSAVAQQLGRAHALVIASFFEGFPLVIGEAMACGTPVISTAFRSGPSEIIQNECNGFLTPVGDERAFANAMLRSLNMPWDRHVIQRSAVRLRLDNLWPSYFDLITNRKQTLSTPPQK